MTYYMDLITMSRQKYFWHAIAASRSIKKISLKVTVKYKWC
jgi:hypothetical protein